MQFASARRSTKGVKIDPEAQLQAAEAAFGIPLDPALRALYAQCNGLQLRSDYVPAGDAPPRDLAPQALDWGEIGNANGDIGMGDYGVIGLLTIEELLASRSFGAEPEEARGDRCHDRRAQGRSGRLS